MRNCEMRAREGREEMGRGGGGKVKGSDLAEGWVG